MSKDNRLESKMLEAIKACPSMRYRLIADQETHINHAKSFSMALKGKILINKLTAN
jgi:hypothetical protein